MNSSSKFFEIFNPKNNIDLTFTSFADLFVQSVVDETIIIHTYKQLQQVYKKLSDCNVPAAPLLLLSYSVDELSEMNLTKIKTETLNIINHLKKMLKIISKIGFTLSSSKHTSFTPDEQINNIVDILNITPMHKYHNITVKLLECHSKVDDIILPIDLPTAINLLLDIKKYDFEEIDKWLSPSS